MNQVTECVQSNNVRSIKELVDAGLAHVPARYIRPLEDRPLISSGQANSTEDMQVPLISLSTTSPSQLLHEVTRACSEWGVFQVVNHGVSTTLQSQIWSATHKFFALPIESKLDIVSQDPSCPLQFFTGFFSDEKIREWKDTLGFKPNPSMNHKLLPLLLREPMLEFHKQMQILAHMLCEPIFSSLGEDSRNFFKYLSRETMTFNYYPSCPKPDLTFGLSSHSDLGSLTILMQDEVKGLQVRRKDVWVDVKPKPNSFIVMLGDQIEILTNGHYKSVEHRVLTNQIRPRMSIACFYAPNDHEVVKPLEKFVNEDCPTMYKETKFNDYLKNGFSRGLNGKANLHFIRSF